MRGNALRQGTRTNVGVLVGLDRKRRGRHAQRDFHAIGGLVHEIDHGRKGHSLSQQFVGYINLTVSSHSVITGGEVLNNGY